MKTSQEYVDELIKRMSVMNTEIAVLKNSGLEIFVNNEHDILEFETRDYPLAERVSIEHYGTYGMDYEMDYDLIQFRFDLINQFGSLIVHCRHEGWHVDDKRYAQASCLEIPYNTKRHNISELIEFYEHKGVKKELLDELKKQVEDLYLQQTPEEEFEEDNAFHLG